MKRNSLAWFQRFWKRILSYDVDKVIEKTSKALGQLSYENMLLRNRVNDIMLILEEMTNKQSKLDDNVFDVMEHISRNKVETRDGMIIINKIPHLYDCVKVRSFIFGLSNMTSCNCGSIPKSRVN